MPVSAEQEEYQQLSQLIPLNTLKQETLENLLQKVTVENIAKGRFLFKQGDVDHVNVYLLDGRVGLYENNNEIDSLESGSATSRFPLAHQLPRKYSAKTLVDSHIVRIDSHLLSEALAQNEEADYTVETSVEPTDDDADWMTQLLQSNVMQHIPAANLQSVMMRMQEIEVKSGDVVITEGEEGDYYYLLHRGRASVLKLDPQSATNNEVAVLSAGASFGEDALLSNNPRSSTIKMLTDGILLRLSKDDFIELIKHPLSDAVSMQDAENIIANGGIWLDVRDQESFQKGHFNGALNIPHSLLRFQLDSLDADRQYVVYSHSGTAGLASAYLLLDKGLQARSLDGGYDDKPEDIADTAEPVATDDGRLDQLQQQLQSRDDELKTALQQIESLQQQLKDDAEKFDAAEAARQENQNKKLQREIIGLTEKLESQEDLYDQLKDKFDALNGDNQKHLKIRELEIAELKETLTVLQLERDQAETDYEDLLAKTRSTDGAASGGNSEDLQHALNQNGQLEALNASISDERDSYKYQLEEIRNELSLANQEISELQLEISDLKGRLAESGSMSNTG